MKKQPLKFQIRYNTISKTEEERWRLLIEDKEILVSDIIVNGHVYTTKDWVDEINDYKWHISCIGYYEIENNIAYIITVKQESVFIRHVLKTISYRLIGTMATVITAYCLGASIQMSSLLGVGELLIKPILYFLHERGWYNWIRIGSQKTISKGK